MVWPSRKLVLATGACRNPKQIQITKIRNWKRHCGTMGYNEGDDRRCVGDGSTASVEAGIMLAWGQNEGVGIWPR